MRPELSLRRLGLKSVSSFGSFLRLFAAALGPATLFAPGRQLLGRVILGAGLAAHRTGLSEVFEDILRNA